MTNDAYIVAELGLNHNGHIYTAIQLIISAKECGADCVKFQTYKTELLCSKKYQPELYEQLKSCEFDYSGFEYLKNYCDKIGIDFMSTPDDLGSAEFLNTIARKFKISSIGAANWHLLRLINTFKKPVFVSNGLINYSGVLKIIELLKDCDVTMMQCVSKYPALKADYWFHDSPDSRLYNPQVGFHYGLSDHTIDLMPPLIGKYIQAYEKHFTLYKSQTGFDHHMSLEPSEFKQYVKNIRNAY